MRYPRLFFKNEELVYHVMSRTALPGYVLTDHDKSLLLRLITQLSKVYFFDILAFCIMGNHFHLMVRNRKEHHFSDEEILNRLYNYYPKFRKDPDHWRPIFKSEIPFWRTKLSNISEFIKDVKQRFSRIYNRDNNRKGYFWGDRFKSVLLESGKAVRGCMAYIDLNPIRANMVKRPEDYPWSSIYLRVKYGRNTETLSDDLYENFSYYGKDTGYFKTEKISDHDVLKFYLKYVYELGLEPSKKGKSIGKNEAKKAFSEFNSLAFRMKVFSNGMVVGSESYIKMCYSQIRMQMKDKANRIRKISEAKLETSNGVFSLIKVKKD